MNSTQWIHTAPAAQRIAHSLGICTYTHPYTSSRKRAKGISLEIFSATDHTPHRTPRRYHATHASRPHSLHATLTPLACWRGPQTRYWRVGACTVPRAHTVNLQGTIGGDSGLRPAAAVCGVCVLLRSQAGWGKHLHAAGCPATAGKVQGGSAQPRAPTSFFAAALEPEAPWHTGSGHFLQMGHILFEVVRSQVTRQARWN